jgi:uncharacterized RDD family membrane protein YckC
MSDPSQPVAVYENTVTEAGQAVRSPEQVLLHLPIAGPTSRMLAYAIDYVVIFMALVGVLVSLILTTPLLHRIQTSLARVFGEMAKGHPQSPADNGAFLIVVAVFLVVQFILESTYFVIAEMISGGRSLGKALVGLRVVRDGGLPISLRESLVRNLLRMVDVLPTNYAVGLVTMMVSADGKRLGDLAAGTIVIRLDRPAPAPALLEADTDGGEFRFDHVQIARLGVNERALLRQTLRRLQTLPPEQAAAILEQAVEVLRARIGYEPVAAAEREQFLRALLHAVRGRGSLE